MVGDTGLPPFQEATGYLPDGEWTATWQVFVDRFGWNDHRLRLLVKLQLGLLAVRKAGAMTAWINGSFTTTKEYPNDVDVLYSAHGVRPLLLPTDFRNRALRREMYGGDYLAVDDTEVRPHHPDGLFAFFRTDDEGCPKGIVRLSLSTVPRLAIRDRK